MTEIKSYRWSDFYARDEGAEDWHLVEGAVSEREAAMLFVEEHALPCHADYDYAETITVEVKRDEDGETQLFDVSIEWDPRAGSATKQ